MLHGCAHPECGTLTLSVYCLEHELLMRAEVEAERAQLPEGVVAGMQTVAEAPRSTA
jgi:hypothetical protein